MERDPTVRGQAEGVFVEDADQRLVLQIAQDAGRLEPEAAPALVDVLLNAERSVV
jgi:hypothetical protein